MVLANRPHQGGLIGVRVPGVDRRAVVQQDFYGFDVAGARGGMSAVSPCPSLESTGAPAARRVLTIAALPFRQARDKGVTPCRSAL